MKKKVVKTSISKARQAKIKEAAMDFADRFEGVMKELANG